MNCVLNDYFLVLGVILLAAIIGKGLWEDHRSFHSRQDLEELARLRKLYTPERETMLRERARLAELEAQYAKEQP